MKYNKSNNTKILAVASFTIALDFIAHQFLGQQTFQYFIAKAIIAVIIMLLYFRAKPIYGFVEKHITPLLLNSESLTLGVIFGIYFSLYYLIIQGYSMSPNDWVLALLHIPEFALSFNIVMHKKLSVV